MTRSETSAGAEAQRRLRRVLALFRSIASHMARDKPEPDNLRLTARVGAISRVALSPSRLGVDLEALVRDEMLCCAVPAARQMIEGVDVRLVAKAAELLALALHELAANSLQYGALSQPQAQLKIRWWRSDRKLTLEWVESAVRMPERRAPGFGTEVVQRAIARELKGSGEMLFSPDGMRCIIAVPLSEALHRND